MAKTRRNKKRRGRGTFVRIPYKLDTVVSGLARKQRRSRSAMITILLELGCGLTLQKEAEAPPEREYVPDPKGAEVTA